MAITRTKIGNLWFNYRGEYDNSVAIKKMILYYGIILTT